MRTLIRNAIVCVCGCVLVWGCSPQAAVGGAENAPAAASGKVQELTDATFEQAIAQGVVLVDFWAPWCGPCKTQGPIVEKVAGLLGTTAKVSKVNVDQATRAAQKFDIRSIPTLIVFKNGKPVKKFVGVTQADALLEAVKAAQ